MNDTEARAFFNDYIYGSIRFHGYTDYMRDYEVVLSMETAFDDYQRLIFENCVFMSAESALPPGAWARSLDNRLLSQSTAAELDGYVWGVKYQEVADAVFDSHSDLAMRWTEAMGFPLREVRIRTNGHHLTLVFSDFRVEQAPLGYSPFERGERLRRGGTIDRMRAEVRVDSAVSALPSRGGRDARRTLLAWRAGMTSARSPSRCRASRRR